MGNSHVQPSQQSNSKVTSMEDIGAHILNADPSLKNVPWAQKQLYARRAIEHAKKQQLEGGTNRVIEPFWEKLALQPSTQVEVAEPAAASTQIRKRSQLFLDSINEPKVRQPTRSELGMNSPSSSISGGKCDDDDDTSSSEEECDE